MTEKNHAIIHARWIYDESRFMAICSHCMGNPTEGTGCGLDISTLEAKYHYCRLCGAKMDEEVADGSISRVSNISNQKSWTEKDTQKKTNQ